MQVLSRTICLTLTATSFLLFAVVVSAADSAANRPATAPNIVLILADDLGWNDVGYHGSEIQTPTLDALAADGVTLSRFYSQPTCTPTRAALMTGKSPQRLGIYRQFAKNSTHGLPTSEATIADHLQDQGYQTWLVGKWHLGHTRWKYHPTQRGFDHFYGHVTGGIGYWDHVHGGGLDWQRNGETLREAGYATHLLTAEAIALLEQRDRSRPFFLYASFNAPHLPNEAPEESIKRYEHIANPYRRMHAAMVTELDQAIGKIVATLREQGLLDNTIVWFLSDNGGLNPEAIGPPFVNLSATLQDWLGAPLPITFLEFVRTNSLEGGGDNSPYRQGKGSVYEGGVRVPSLLHWPQGLGKRTVEEMITVQDVLPTLLALAGETAPADLDGKNRLPAILAQTSEPPNDYVTMSQYGAQAYYRWPWKLINDEEQVELYHIENDPLEQQDLAALQPEKTAELISALEALPRAETLHIPLYKVMWDPDFFGGSEDRPPWADIVTRDAEFQGE